MNYYMEHLRGQTKYNNNCIHYKSLAYILPGDRTTPPPPPDMYPPDTYPKDTYPTVTYPLDTYPLDTYPLGHIHPGHLPPGHLPPGHLPPRTYTPQDIYPLYFKMPYLVHASCVDYILHFKKYLFCRNSICL